MADLYDTKKKKLVRFDNDAQITDAIASGTFLPKKGEKLYATNPLGEKTYIPSEQAKDAITQGYVIHGKTTELADDYVRENEGLSGAAKVFFGQAVDEAALGIPELIYDKTQTPLEVAKKEALKKHFSALNIAGGVTGAAASFFYGGPAFKAATKAGEATGKAVTKALSARAAGEVSEKGIKKAAEKIIGTGVEGALLSAPYAFTEAVLGDPDDAAETLMYGVGLGSLFGGVSEMAGGLSKLASKAKVASEAREKLSNAIKDRKDLRKLGQEKAVEALNPNLGQQERLQAMEELVDETGNLVGVKPTQRLEVIGKDLLDENIITPLSSKADMYDKLLNRNTELRKDVGDALQKFDDDFGDLARINTDELITNIRSAISNNNLFQTAAYKPFVKRVETQLENLAESGATLSLRQANLEKSAFQKIAEKAYISQNAGIDVNTAEVVATIPREINKMIRQTTRRLDVEAAETLIEKQRLLGNLTQAENIARKSAAREARNNDFGLTSINLASGGIAGGAIIGGPVGAIIGGLIPMLGRELARRYGDQTMAVALNKYGGMLFAEQAMKKSAEKIDRLPEIIKRMSEAKKVLPTKKTTALEATSRIFRYKDDKDEKELKQPRAIKEYKIKKIERIRDDMIKWISNPDLSTTKISELVKPIGEEGAPVIAERLSAKMGEAISYLYQEVPKPVAPDSLFAPKARYEPSEYEMNKFLQKAQVVSDPFSVFDEMESGTITMHHMDALRTIYPGLHRYMVEKITDYAAENPTELNYQERLRLSILMDSAIDQSLRPDRIRSFQQVYVKEDFQDQDLPGREQIEIQGDLGQSLVTNSQRLA